MSRQQRRARLFPAGKQAFPTLPDQVKEIVAQAGEDCVSWHAAYLVAEDFKNMAMASATSGPLTKEEYASHRSLFGAMVAALIERMNGAPKNCTNPFQAALYNVSIRKDHLQAGKRYRQKAGGDDGHLAEMRQWVKDHPDKAARGTGGIALYATEYEGAGPQTMEETLEVWTRRAIEEFNTKGEIRPMAIGLRPDGSGVIFTNPGFRSEREINNFEQAAYAQFDELGCGRIVRLNEAWATESEDHTVSPSQSDDRKEIVFVTVSEDGSTIANVMPVERDWKTGRATLGPPDLTGEAHSSMGRQPATG